MSNITYKILSDFFNHSKNYEETEDPRVIDNKTKTTKYYLHPLSDEYKEMVQKNYQIHLEIITLSVFSQLKDIQMLLNYHIDDYGI